MKINENQWNSMEINENQYNPLDFHGMSWNHRWSSAGQLNAAQYSSIQLNRTWEIIEYAYVLDSPSSTMNLQNSLKLNEHWWSSMELNEVQWNSMKLEKSLNTPMLWTVRALRWISKILCIPIMKINENRCKLISLGVSSFSLFSLEHFEATREREARSASASASEGQRLMRVYENLFKRICWELLRNCKLALLCSFDCNALPVPCQERFLYFAYFSHTYTNYWP